MLKVIFKLTVLSRGFPPTTTGGPYRLSDKLTAPITRAPAPARQPVGISDASMLNHDGGHRRPTTNLRWQSGTGKQSRLARQSAAYADQMKRGTLAILPSILLAFMVHDPSHGSLKLHGSFRSPAKLEDECSSWRVQRTLEAGVAAASNHRLGFSSHVTPAPSIV